MNERPAVIDVLLNWRERPLVVGSLIELSVAEEETGSVELGVEELTSG